MRKVDKHMIGLLRVALGNAESCPAASDWHEVLDLAARQNVMGMVYLAVCRLPEEERPSIELMMKLEDFREDLERHNRQLNATCVALDKLFWENGYRTAVIKGQAMAALYERPLLRSWGDIDLWMDGGKEHVVQCIQSHFTRTEEPGDFHIAAVLKDGTALEVHYLPTVLANPRLNGKLQAWIDKQQPKQWSTTRQLPEDAGSIHVSTADFDVVFLTLHFFRHWTFEGCGMKQLLDIYHVLLRGEVDREEAYRALSQFGMKHLCQALMYVMGELGLPREKMICEPSNRLGKLFMNDVLQTGWVSADELLTGKIGQENKLHKLLRRLWRHMRLFPLAPREIPYLLPTSLLHKVKD